MRMPWWQWWKCSRHYGTQPSEGDLKAAPGKVPQVYCLTDKELRVCDGTRWLQQANKNNHNNKCPINYSSQEYLGEVGSFPVNSSTPVSVISNVCSNCAVASPSDVAAVHLSGHWTGFALPKQIIGSIVNV